MDDLARRVRGLGTSRENIKRTFPMLTDWPLQDEDTLIHSLGISYWMHLGMELGMLSACEIPAPPGPISARTSQGVRSDVVWFTRPDYRPICFVEFERYAGSDSDKRKLVSKAENLYLAGLRWSTEETLLILAYWTLGLKSFPDHSGLLEIGRHGFCLADGTRIRSTKAPTLQLLHYVFRSNESGEVTLDEVIPRGPQ